MKADTTSEEMLEAKAVETGKQLNTLHNSKTYWECIGHFDTHNIHS